MKQKVIVGILFGARPSVVASAIAILTIISTVVHLLTESWWFEAVGFADVFWQQISWQVIIWLGTLVIFSLFLWLNYWLALQFTRDRNFRFLESHILEPYTKQVANYIVLVLTFLFSLGLANTSANAWEIILKFLNATEFNNKDPIYNRDIGFYLFRYPLYDYLEDWTLTLLIAGLFLAVLVYLFKGIIRFDWRWKNLVIDRQWQKFLNRKIQTHLSILLAAISLNVAVDFWLERYELLYSSYGVVWGADYTDTHARLFAYWVMTVASVILGIFFILAIWSNKTFLPFYGIAVYASILILVNGFLPTLQQRFIVEPNELVKELPYIKHNINYTRQAYNLETVDRNNYQLADTVNPNLIPENQATIENIKLWDTRPLLSTYRQLQEIRFYYKFQDVDVDRYTLNGDYRQVMLSAREFDYALVPNTARTWVNQRLKYTHGYGLVMNPVNQVTPDGLPLLWIKNIPPLSLVDLTITEPAIYYGELTEDYIFTGMDTFEFDYPRGDENAFTKYDGVGGVPLPNWGRRLAYAYDKGSLKILISNYFTPNARIHYYRKISDRIRHVAPFLQFDRDPYLVLINGRLKWIVDAYTTSDRFPYAEPIAHEHPNDFITNQNINYIRNPVKVVVDAKDGTMQFYVVDKNEPILATYRKIFPSLFQDTIPPEIEAHFRYPQDLFEIQAKIYLAYHISDPQVFYNREDLWRFATELNDGQQEEIDPYYLIMRLPGETTPEFSLLLPFTPINKDNMIALMAALSDGANYGKLKLYEFPKQELIYGPFQIEARIDQDPDISEQFTLWSQRGSNVIRGDILVIPVNGSILYVQSVYLRAKQGELPELTRVIVANNQKIIMSPTLETSLNAVLNQEAPFPIIPTTADDNLTRSALSIYQKAQQALQQGNWIEYGRYQQQLQDILQQLNE